MKTKAAFSLMLLAISLLGCGKQPEPRHIVILPDVSGSIDRETLKQAFKAIDEMVSHLHRGDRIAIIPILSDAEAEASGRILRFTLPNSRQAYDSDLRDFRARLQKALAEMEAAAIAHPGSKTDILGSIVLAEQEFQANSEQSKSLLLILSDFIQEDREIDFRKDKRLATVEAAQALAKDHLAVSHSSFTNVSVFLGLLKSREYAALDWRRRNAINGFWIQYLGGAKIGPRFVADGIGLLKSEQF
jgi:hypothetical protein